MDTTSYWIDSGPLPPFPRPSRDLQVDVLVIGGGITGVTAAYLAKKAGLTVALLERDRFARVDTGHTTAHLTCVTDARLRHLTTVFGAEAARAVWDAGGAAIDEIFHLIGVEGIRCDFQWVPGYLHAPLGSPKDRSGPELEEEATAALQLAIPAVYLPRVPFFNVPGVRFPHQALFHPRKYLGDLLRRIPGRGSHVFEAAPAEEILKRPLAVKTGGHRIRGRHLVIATHTPLMGNTAMAPALLLQTKLALYTSYALGARLPAGMLPAACFWDTADPYTYLRVEPRRGYDYAIFGGEDHKSGQADDTQACYRRLERKFLAFAPQARIDHRWSGQVITTNDGLPLIGETAPHQFVATGYAGNGMTFGTLGAMMAVDAILGRANPWRKLLDVHRKKLLGGTWNYLKENKDYPYYFVRDRLARAEGKSLRALRTGEGRLLNLGGRKVAAYRGPDGKVTLCSPVCTHLQGIVGWNRAEKTWDCPCHGARFRPTGEVLAGPAEDPLEKIPVPAPGGA
jgi:glycine/D-amino acid oxidase-like deaminating enzyme/nitrite reductase/ring-hydroxylating ferredoxin subunit